MIRRKVEKRGKKIRKMIVMKFGGTSVQDAAAIERMMEIVRGRLPERPLVAVSAMAKVTRVLCEIAEAAARQDAARADGLLAGLLGRHHAVAEALLSDDAERFMQTVLRIDAVGDNLSACVEEVISAGRLTDCDNARILSCGELLSSIIVSAAMNAAGIDCVWLDARDLMTTDENYLAARPDRTVTAANVKAAVAAESDAQVLLTQGFIARTATGDPAVLGFEGSDYSAAIFGACIDASRVEIWTDVDGIRTADPRIVPGTGRIPRLSYEEAAEMAYLGARVLHPLTIGPAREKGIPIHVLNSSNPAGEGSVVCDGAGTPDGPKSLALLTAQDIRELRTRTMLDVTEKVQISVIGKNIAADRDRIAACIRNVDAGCAVSLAENGLSFSAVVDKDLAQEALLRLHAELF